MKRALFLVFAAVTAATAARADVIAAATSSAGLGANDSVSFDQLGPDGTTVSQNFSVTSANGITIKGSFANGTGTVCTTGGNCASAYNFATTSILGGGAVSFTLPGASAIGAYVLSDVANQTYSNNGTFDVSFSASLSVYNGSTLLGTVTGTSDTSADPFYLGLVDTSGAHITKAVYSLTAINTGAQDAVDPTVKFSYDAQGGFSDPSFCGSLTNSDLINQPINRLRCPQAAAASDLSLPLPTLSYSDYLNIKNLISPNIVVSLQGGSPAVPASTDTDPGDLAQFYVAQLDLAATNTVPPVASVPEPATLALLGGWCAGLALYRRRTSAGAG